VMIELVAAIMSVSSAMLLAGSLLTMLVMPALFGAVYPDVANRLPMFVSRSVFTKRPKLPAVEKEAVRAFHTNVAGSSPAAYPPTVTLPDTVTEVCGSDFMKLEASKVSLSVWLLMADTEAFK